MTAEWLFYRLDEAQDATRSSSSDEMDDADPADPDARERFRAQTDACPHFGCILRERHRGLCMFQDTDEVLGGGNLPVRATRTKGMSTISRRQEVEEQTEILSLIRKQLQRRAGRRGDGEAIPAKVIPGTRMAQFHPSLNLREFGEGCVIAVYEGVISADTCIGQVRIIASHIVADLATMLRAELGVDPFAAELWAVPRGDTGAGGASDLVDLLALPREVLVVEHLPSDTPVDLRLHRLSARDVAPADLAASADSARSPLANGSAQAARCATAPV